MYTVDYFPWIISHRLDEKLVEDAVRPGEWFVLETGVTIVGYLAWSALSAFLLECLERYRGLLTNSKLIHSNSTLQLCICFGM